MKHHLAGLVACAVMTFSTALPAAPPQLTFVARADNDLYTTLRSSLSDLARFDTSADAIEHAGAGTAILILADGYPGKRNAIDDALLDHARAKHLRLYIEYPETLPGLTFEAPRSTTWERLVVASDSLGESLPQLRIMMAHECRFVPVAGVENPLLVIARVAGYDSAIFGLPEQPFPILFEMPEHNALVATTKLSHFVTGRYAPTAEWKALWTEVLRRLDPAADRVEPNWKPLVGFALAANDPVTPEVEKHTLERAACWITNSRLLITENRFPDIKKRLTKNNEVSPAPSANAPRGDGSLGILEGYASGIQLDGSQLQRQPIRFDCQAESAMVLALSGDKDHSAIAQNLLDYSFFTSDMSRNGPRGDPKHPSYGLLAWGTISRAWTVANYGDDNARSILATILAAAVLKTDRYDESLLAALYANLRTTGKLGFRGDRIDQPRLERLGWKHFHESEPVNPAPNFEAYLWACYLWAHHQTGEMEFLEKSKTAIRMTMDAYARKGWRWNDSLERARMLLPLAWLVRVEDTTEHRAWVKTVAGDLLQAQAECGAIQERLAGTGAGHYSIPASNEAYGTGETPLIQTNGDPVSDQLYTTGFALLALREAAVATDDAVLRDAENKLAAYLCRIQTRSERHPEFDGWWFRAFDYNKWEAWASSADFGWGAFSLEAGWAQAWTAATLALRAEGTTFWDKTASSEVEKQLPIVREKMMQNAGGPLASHP